MSFLHNTFVILVIPVLEPAETPIQKLLDTVGQGDNPEADGGFCKYETPLSSSTSLLTASLGSVQSYHII